MILVADSGSTKCDWILTDDNNEIPTGTMGFNPFFHSTDLILNKIKENEILSDNISNISAVYFYGAGCSSPERNAIVENALRLAFPEATEIVVDHDETAAAIATCGDMPGIACILGTGSNSCFFDGTQTSYEIPALGYVLGDEGSGAFFGKALLKEFLYKRLPADIHEDFVAEFGIDKEEIFNAVYHKPNPNVYLASFMRFISERREHPYFKERIYEGLASFANAHITCFQNYKEVPVHFVGSIAYYFREVLEEVANNYRFTIGEVIKKPITNLKNYHLKQMTVG